MQVHFKLAVAHVEDSVSLAAGPILLNSGIHDGQPPEERDPAANGAAGLQPAHTLQAAHSDHHA